MATMKRHSRDRDRVCRAILQAARQLFVREGYANVSMRKIAGRIDYSAAAIYLYFPSKADIFYALAEEGFRRFSAAMATPGRDDDALAALEDRFWRYYEFSKKQPEFFWLMFVDRSVPRISREWDRFAFVQQTRAEGAELVRQCVDAGLFPRGTSAPAAFHVLATAIHGAAVHRLCGRFDRRRDADDLARDTLRAVIAGLRAGVALAYQPGGGRPGIQVDS
jgi:AcrR family transcriptional regulator